MLGEHAVVGVCVGVCALNLTFDWDGMRKGMQAAGAGAGLVQ